ncbi:Uncharacterised protein [Citrobacter freundii]|nr:Uncharacterised protein [Citrobacter freundii]
MLFFYYRNYFLTIKDGRDFTNILQMFEMSVYG